MKNKHPSKLFPAFSTSQNINFLLYIGRKISLCGRKKRREKGKEKEGHQAYSPVRRCSLGVFLSEVVNDGPQRKQSDANTRVKDPLVLSASTLDQLNDIPRQPQGIGSIQHLALR